MVALDKHIIISRFASLYDVYTADVFARLMGSYTGFTILYERCRPHNIKITPTDLCSCNNICVVVDSVWNFHRNPENRIITRHYPSTRWCQSVYYNIVDAVPRGSFSYKSKSYDSVNRNDYWWEKRFFFSGVPNNTALGSVIISWEGGMTGGEPVSRGATRGG